MILFRNASTTRPFLWETAAQAPARWHGAGDGPVAYLAETPDGAWAEFLRHEEITDPADLEGVSRAMWAIEVELPELGEPDLGDGDLLGGPVSYEACQAEARRLSGEGARGLVAPSAALRPGTASGWRTDGGLRAGEPREELTIVLFGRHPELVGWAACADGRPRADLLLRVRPLAEEARPQIPAPVAAASPADDPTIRQLAALRQAGILTDQEYEAAVAKLTGPR